MLQNDDTTDTVETLSVTDGDDATTTTTTTTPVEDRGDSLGGDIDQATLGSVVAEADAHEGEPAPGAKPNSPFIPVARFNQVNQAKNDLAEKLAAAELELETLRKGSAPPPPAATPAPAPAEPEFDVQAKEIEYADALMEGDSKRAAGIRQEINAHIQEQASLQAEARIERRNSAQTQADALQAASAQAVADFPYLDTPEGEDAMDLILLARDKSIRAGVEPAKALADAVSKIAPRFAPQEATPQPGEGTPGSRLPTAAPATDNRTTNAIARGAQDSMRQAPIAPVGLGNRATETRLDVSQMTEKQFEALPEAEKKRLRGDV